MKFRKLREIWKAEFRYEEFRWSEGPLENRSDQSIADFRDEVTDMLDALNPWLSKPKISKENIIRINIFKRKLIEYQWLLIQEMQRRERVSRHKERLEKMLEPEEIGEGLLIPNFGLRGPIKGSDFYKDIPRDLLAPVPREGALPS